MHVPLDKPYKNTNKNRNGKHEQKNCGHVKEEGKDEDG
jgi:hypothetical protein